ncbi:hypothetical protein NP493_519g03003 [Ridgeia piscesae]|uniref:Uncharacterized protein n=1 Tax=Ridgeia piscesae TaxID=27915 RepID=A0AAD9KX47_RIDPI|nr:hypothetical protein NP493_519g03003 [Ridgeia piscesae]
MSSSGVGYGHGGWCHKDGGGIVTDNTKEKNKTNSRTKNKDYRSQVVIPYVEGVSERVHRVKKKYGVVNSRAFPHHPQAPAGTSTSGIPRWQSGDDDRPEMREVVPRTLVGQLPVLYFVQRIHEILRVVGTTGPRCVSSCSELVDGNYQSCLACNVYVMCIHRLLHDNQPCRQRHFVWDDFKRSCQPTSRTCKVTHGGCH